VKVTIPEDLKQDLPQTPWGKILSVTPVVMTVVATLLAGLASSEMTRAQYDRALGAQLQSKAGDQWGYFQAKKLRGAMQRTSLDLLRASSEIGPIDAARLGGGVGPAVVAALQKGVLPEAGTGAPVEAPIAAAMAAVEGYRPETEISGMLAQVPEGALAEALAIARRRGGEFDAVTKPVNDAIDRIEGSIPADDKALRRDVSFARIRYAAARYDAEARLNQTVANLLELQVRKSNNSAERHHRRSGSFFFGMLGAQAAVIISTFAVAARKRNFLWTVAAFAGVTAVAFAIYVYVRL